MGSNTHAIIGAQIDAAAEKATEEHLRCKGGRGLEHCIVPYVV
jgi:hypothetical protein